MVFTCRQSSLTIGLWMAGLDGSHVRSMEHLRQKMDCMHVKTMELLRVIFDCSHAKTLELLRVIFDCRHVKTMDHLRQKMDGMQSSYGMSLVWDGWYEPA